MALSSRSLPVAGIVLALGLLAGAVLLTHGFLRSEFRAQLARRDVALVSGLLNERFLTASSATSDDLVALLEAADQPDIPGIRSISLHDTNGFFIAALSLFGDEPDLPPSVLPSLADGEPVSRFGKSSELETDSLAALLAGRIGGDEPVLEVLLRVPPRQGPLVGYARYVLDGSDLAKEYAALDHTLGWQALTAFLLAGAAMTVALAFVFHRLVETQRHLVGANRELTLAAKTAAVGAVTAHLIHGLKNPLAGLQQFVASASDPASAETMGDWSEAAQTAQRMRAMIDAVTGVLREESGMIQYEIAPREVLDQLARRERPYAREASVTLAIACNAVRPLPNRDANIALLILENLVRNAVQACAEGGCVRVCADEESGDLVFRVRDEGTGLPERVRRNLFSPVATTKEGGTGLGLALSQQLARCLAAQLELVESGSMGTEFMLRMPRGAMDSRMTTGTSSEAPVRILPAGLG